jgi:hypothetical protein
MGIGKSNLPPTKRFVNYYKGLVINYNLQVFKKGIPLDKQQVQLLMVRNQASLSVMTIFVHSDLYQLRDFSNKSL